jgi:MFS family permease
MGHRVVLLAGVIAGVVANAIALAATSPGVFGLVFVLAGVQTASATISGLNVLLEFAPAAEAQPTYVGLGHTSLAPMAVAAPIGAGAIADAVGFPAVFVIAALGGITATLVLALRVRDPRHVRTMAAAESGA